MFRFVGNAASRMDTWLHDQFGRPYGVIISVGLVGDIAHRIRDLPEFLSQRHKLVGLALAVVMELALLIHQFAEMHQRSQHARAVDEPEMDTAAQ